MSNGIVSGSDVALEILQKQNEDALYEFKRTVGNKIASLSNCSRRIAELQAQIDAIKNVEVPKIKEELKALTFTPVDETILA